MSGPPLLTTLDAKHPNTWLQHFIDAAGPIPRYSQFVTELEKSQKSLPPIHSGSTKGGDIEKAGGMPVDTATPITTPHDQRLQHGKPFDSDTEPSSRTPSSTNNPFPTSDIDFLSYHLSIITQSVSECFSAFRVLCVPKTSLATGTYTTLSLAQLKEMTETTATEARAMDVVETLYYNCFYSLVDTREDIEIRVQEGSGIGWKRDGEKDCTEDLLAAAWQVKVADSVVTDLASILNQMARKDGLDVEKTWWFGSKVKLKWLYDHN